MNKIKLFAVATVLLAGCVSQNSVVQDSSASGAAAGGGFGTAAARPAAPPAASQIINKTAISGQSIEIVNLTNVNPDCTPGALGYIRITQAPNRGHAVLTQQDVYPNFPANNPRSKCNSRKFPGIVLTYTSNPGFTGSDLMAIEIFTQSGDDSNEIKVLITVK